MESTPPPNTFISSSQSKPNTMKNVLSLIGFISLLSTLQSQNYEPMALEGAHWIIFSINDQGYNHHALSIRGDTVLNGLDYKKIYRQDIKNQVAYPVELVPPYQFDTTYLQGFLRDDPDEQQVFGIFLQNTLECPPMTDQLLYDFSLQAGDTINGCLNILPFHDPSVVDSTVVEFLWEKDRKVLYANESTDLLIEGVGTMLGPFTSIIGEVHPGSPTALIDYCRGTDTECGLLFTSNQETFHYEQIKVFPNPTNQYLTIELPDGLTFPLRLRVTNTLGALVLDKTITHPPSQEILTTNTWHRGIYQILLQHKEGVLTEQFVKN